MCVAPFRILVDFLGSSSCEVPTPEFDKLPGSKTGEPSSSRMELYITHLTLRPSNDSPAELYDNVPDTSGRATALLTSSSSAYFLAASESSDNTTVGLASTESQNPESDSFTYIEMLLESLAVLGKLVGALDTVIQRMPIEIYSLVDSTIDEVNDRSEFIRLTPSNAATGSNRTGVASSSGSKYIFVDRKPTDDLASSMRLASLEASAKESDRETIRDLFWTLYSKLDAVLQGFRVTYEVANRIGKVRASMATCLSFG